MNFIFVRNNLDLNDLDQNLLNEDHLLVNLSDDMIKDNLINKDESELIKYVNKKNFDNDEQRCTSEFAIDELCEEDPELIKKLILGSSVRHCF